MMKLYKKQKTIEKQISCEEVISELEELINTNTRVDTQGIIDSKEIEPKVIIGYIQQQLLLNDSQQATYTFTGIRKEYQNKQPTKIELVLKKTTKPKYENQTKNYNIATTGSDKQLTIIYTKGQYL
jgi:hypothetical protein